MTTPHGHPDYQDFANAISPNLFPSFTQVLTPGVHNFGIVPVANWSSITVEVAASAGAGQVSVQHFADMAGTQSIGSDTWLFNTGMQPIVRSPLRGQFAQLSINVTSAGNVTAVTYAAFQSVPADRISFPVATQTAQTFNRSIPANTTDTYSYLRMVAGRAWFSFFAYDTTQKLDIFIQTVDELNNPQYFVAELGTPTSFLNTPLEIPDTIVHVLITNLDAVNPHSYDFSLVIPPQ